MFETNLIRWSDLLINNHILKKIGSEVYFEKKNDI